MKVNAAPIVSAAAGALLALLALPATSHTAAAAAEVDRVRAGDYLVERAYMRRGFRANYYSYYAWPRYYPGLYNSYLYYGYPAPRGYGWRWNGAGSFYWGPRFYSGPYFPQGWRPW